MILIIAICSILIIVAFSITAIWGIVRENDKIKRENDVLLIFINNIRTGKIKLKNQKDWDDQYKKIIKS